LNYLAAELARRELVVVEQAQRTRLFLDSADSETNIFNGLLDGVLIELAGFEFRLFAAHVDLDRVFLYTR
jgi:hypothetical protein